MCLPLGLLLVLLGAPGLLGLRPQAEHYEVVYPARLPVPRTRRELSSGPTAYPESLRYVLPLRGSNFTLQLRRNRDLTGAAYTETYTSAEGAQVTEQPDQLQDHCFYQGHVEGHRDSAASISACQGLRGFFQTGSTVHVIEPLPGASHEGRHAVYRAERLTEKLVTCGVSNATLEEELEPKMAAAQKPRNWKSGAASRGTRYVELFVVVDYTESVKIGSRQAIRNRVKEIVNHVDKLYQELDFRVVLIGLEIWNSGDQTHISSSPEATLDNFLRWRSQVLVPRKKHDNAQLITGVDFEKTTVGLARVASMCTAGSGAVNQDHNDNPIGVASTIAHEMGHNLGMDHDENVPSCYCHAHSQNGGCIMAASLSAIFPKAFSSCSRHNLENFVGDNNFQASCLTNSPKLDDIFGGPVCGNKFVERGEECDCGAPEECTNHCCNATTCRLATGATCAHGECCRGCQVTPAGETCREARGDCDLAEHCDGRRGVCPEDAFRENGSPCRGGYCYDGACPTLQQQCRALWGAGAYVASDECFSLSVRAQCSASSQPRSDKCGVLHCAGVTSPTRAYCRISLGGRVPCFLATKGEGHEPFEQVAPGTRCGEHMVCYGGRCQDLRVYGPKNCSAQCSGHGVCNHKRDCHCEPGWAPPDCRSRVSDYAAPGAPGVLVGVLVTVGVLALLLGAAFLLHKRRLLPPIRKRRIATQTPGLANPLFREGGGKAPGPISHPPPAAQRPNPPLDPGVPRRAPPVVSRARRGHIWGAGPGTPGSRCWEPPLSSQPPAASFNVPVYAAQTPQPGTPAPPSKPLPPLKPKQVIKPQARPPPPPGPSAVSEPQGAARKVPLMPPARR
ncbi:disintegrin and metalloproteinase domain-containing protein 8 isoform X2 [Monodelphis domestica]|uniref:disintegrin and metalloproteinase domain-containing protein 8 isoform X2 n=1 Tax=Monodelphis domestica TaxID=13616 RepID=UPI0024E20C72|nr:disintegrin and metalloproteinase domain-containing protein 8 isoform X2 [Monodelphis domestica]